MMHYFAEILDYHLLYDYAKDWLAYLLTISSQITCVLYELDLFFIHSFIQAISIAPLQVHYYSEALLTQHGYCAGVSLRSATGNCELRTCPRSLRGV